jgi:RNA polymerase sigma factor (sigma-70 family)
MGVIIVLKKWTKFLKQHKSYSEKELITGCVQNDRFSQELLYKKFFPTCVQYCKKYTTNQEELLEIINTGFLRVFQKLSTFNHLGSLEGWIKKIMLHALSDYFRKKNSYQTVEWEDAHDEVLKPSVLTKLYENDLIGLLQKLPKSTATVFELFVMDGCSHEEISKQLNISTGTSKWHLSEAKKRLRMLIENQQIKENHVVQYTNI